MAAGRRLAVAREALKRQARQTVLAIGIAGLALLTLAPVTMAIRAAVAEATDHGVPLGEAFVAAACGKIIGIVITEIGLAIMRGKLRLWLVGRTLAVFASACGAVVMLAWHVGGVDATQHSSGKSNIITGAAGLLIVTLISALARPMAVFLRPDQGCGSRLRRTMRALKVAPVWLAAAAPAYTVIWFVYLTVFTQLTPAKEVLLMGVGMPLLQATCMTLSAYVTGRTERQLQKRKTKQGFGIKSTAPSVGKVLPSGDPTSKFARIAELEDKDKNSRTDDLKAGKGVQGANASGNDSDSSEGETQTSLMMVLMAEVFYSMAAFATMALTESDGALLLSLVLLLTIEIVQVVLHVKARRAVSRVANDTTADTLLGNDICILQWLLHQELGEKIGLFMALGFVAVDKTLGRDVQAVNAVSMTRLAYRGLAMVLMELVGDLGKDIVSQAIGLMPAAQSLNGVAATAARVTLPPMAIAFVILACLLAGSLVQCGLALGTP